TSEDYPEFVCADRFRVRGLAVRLRDSGLGVPLIGVGQEEADTGASRLRFRPAEVPATVFLRLAGGIAELEGGTTAEFELHSAFDTTSVEVAGRSVPLETDLSAALAHALDRPDIWRFSVTGL